MTQTPPEPTDRANLLESLVRIARSPATIAVGGTVIGVGIAGYLGIQYFVWEQLSPLLESQLSQILKREVRVGGGDMKQKERSLGDVCGRAGGPKSSTSLSVKLRVVNAQKLGQPPQVSRTIPNSQWHMVSMAMPHMLVMLAA